MKKNTVMVILLLTGVVTYISSCYNNRSDIVTPVSTVSFSKQVVPILTAGPCGCHNTKGATNTLGSASAVRFSNGNFNGRDTILYDVILSRAASDAVQNWAAGKASHPGGGDVFLTPLESALLINWFKQGTQDDSESGGGSTNVTYTNDIASIVKNTCSSSSCHGGIAVAFSYSKLTSDASVLTTIVANKGTTGHPGGKLSLSSSTWSTLQKWINQGMPQ